MLVVVFGLVYSIYITVMHINISGGHFMRQKTTRFSFIFRVFMVLALVLLGSLGIYQSSSADTAQSVADYCGRFNSKIDQGACKEGLKSSPDCLSYSDMYGAAAAGICNQSTADLKAGVVSLTAATNPSVSPSSSVKPEINTSNKEKEAYKGAILLACAPYQDNEAAALWCLYGGLGKDGKEHKPQSDCFTKNETKGSVLNQTACQTGSEAGKTYQDSVKKSNDSNNGSGSSILDLFGGLFGPTVSSSGKTSDANAKKNQQMSIQQLMAQMGGAIDMLHQLSPNAGTKVSDKQSNSLDSYINGAGRKQKIIDLNPTHPKGAPAILFFNGGAWHFNDSTGQAVMAGSPCKNFIMANGEPGAPCAGGGGLGDFGIPGGGGGVARGYAGFDVTYRLGSSGVYYMLEDVLRGIRHIIANADRYGIDPEKIIIWGDSAGGSLSMRAAASGISGAKVAVGWSPPVNAYTVLFASYKTFMLGLDHSTCIPTDLAGLANMTDLMLGGGGKIAEYGQGLASNDFGFIMGLGSGDTSGVTEDPAGLIGGLLTAAQYAGTSAMNAEAITQQLLAAYNEGAPNMNSVLNSGLTGGVFNMASKKLVECMDNLKALSPAIYASPNTPPSFLAGFDTDDVVPPQQLYDMRDKLRTLGIRSDALVLTGDDNADYPAFGASTNHLGYDPRMVCPTFNFIESVMSPEKGAVNCGTGLRESTYQNTNIEGAAPEVPGLFQLLNGLTGTK